MKKKILGGLLVVAIAAVAAFNVNMNTQDNELSLLALTNVELLAFGENSGKSCIQKSEYKSDSMNGTRCGSWDRYSSVSKSCTVKKCEKGAGYSCESGTKCTGNDCNNDYSNDSSQKYTRVC